MNQGFYFLDQMYSLRFYRPCSHCERIPPMILHCLVPRWLNKATDTYWLSCGECQVLLRNCFRFKTWAVLSGFFPSLLPSLSSIIRMSIQDFHVLRNRRPRSIDVILNKCFFSFFSLNCVIYFTAYCLHILTSTLSIVMCNLY